MKGEYRTELPFMCAEPDTFIQNGHALIPYVGWSPTLHDMSSEEGKGTHVIDADRAPAPRQLRLVGATPFVRVVRSSRASSTDVLLVRHPYAHGDVPRVQRVHPHGLLGTPPRACPCASEGYEEGYKLPRPCLLFVLFASDLSLVAGADLRSCRLPTGVVPEPASRAPLCAPDSAGTSAPVRCRFHLVYTSVLYAIPYWCNCTARSGTLVLESSLVKMIDRIHLAPSYLRLSYFHTHSTQRTQTGPTSRPPSARSIC